VRRANQALAVTAAVLGVLLVLRGAAGGVWPLTVQTVAGVLLLVLAGARWWLLR
jgi:hypothetical protein